LRGSNSTAWRVNNKVQSLAPRKTVNGCHETVFILVVYFDSSYVWLGKKPRIISDNVPTGFLLQVEQMGAFNNVYTMDGLGKELAPCGFLIGLIYKRNFFCLGFLNLLKNTTPIRHVAVGSSCRHWLPKARILMAMADRNRNHLRPSATNVGEA